MNFDFLSKVVLDADASAPRRPKKERMPTTAHLRVFKNGSVYPSKALVEALGLEYRPLVKDEAGKWVEPEDPGYGFDVCLSTEFPAFKVPQPVVVISTVSRIHPKVSLFGSVSYIQKPEDAVEGLNEGDPTVSVTEQGSATFGSNELLPMLADTYKVVPGKDGYIDLMLVGTDGTPGVDSPWVFNRPVYVPKKVARGETKGQASTVRRENGKYFVLVPVMETAGQVGVQSTAEPVEAAGQPAGEAVPA